MKEKRNVLRTRRLVMRPLEEEDREAMLRMLTDERIRKTYMIPVFRSRERADAYYDRLTALSAVILSSDVLSRCRITDGNSCQENEISL